MYFILRCCLEHKHNFHTVVSTRRRVSTELVVQEHQLWEFGYNVRRVVLVLERGIIKHTEGEEFLELPEIENLANVVQATLARLPESYAGKFFEKMKLLHCPAVQCGCVQC